MRSEDSIVELLKWIGDGPRLFGQVLISHVPNGVELRHTEDAERSVLETFTDCDEAQRIANFDDNEIYRPLKTAPNLRHGWRLVLRSGSEVFRALSFFYPAMVGVWLAQRDGELVAVNLRETLGRQTGMYRVTQKLTDEQAQQVIGRMCCGSACMKTILWRVNADLPINSLPAEKLTPTRESGRMPLLCHEACNLLVAAARKVVKGEGE